MTIGAIPAEPDVPPSTWSIIKKSKLITLGAAFVITCLICAGSIQIFILYMDARLKEPEPDDKSVTKQSTTPKEVTINPEDTLKSIIPADTLKTASPSETPNTSITLEVSIEPSKPLTLEKPPILDISDNTSTPLKSTIPENLPISNSDTSTSDIESESSILVNGPESNLASFSLDDENLLVIPFPKPENISSVVIKVRKVIFTSPFRSAVADNEIAKEDVSKFAYRNLLAIQQVFTKSLLQYRFTSAEQVWIDKIVHRITDFIRRHMHLLHEPRSSPGFVHEFPENLDEFTDRFVDENSRWLFYDEFLRYQRIWNEEVVPLLLNKISLCALNGAFNSAVKLRYSKLVNAVSLPAIPNFAKPYINPIYISSILRKDSFNELLGKIKQRIKYILAANNTSDNPIVPLKDYKLSDTEQLDYYISLLNLLVDRYPQSEKRDDN